MDTSRIDDLRRRVQQDPASIAFAQLAEEYRRAGQFQESVDVARSGLLLHPGYVSARVTLGRALLQLGMYDAAYHELALVRETAPDNLAAIRDYEATVFTPDGRLRSDATPRFIPGHAPGYVGQVSPAPPER